MLNILPVSYNSPTPPLKKIFFSILRQDLMLARLALSWLCSQASLEQVTSTLASQVACLTGLGLEHSPELKDVRHGGTCLNYEQWEAEAEGS